MIFICEVPLCRYPVLQALYEVQHLVERDDSPALTLSRVPAMDIVVIPTEMILNTDYAFSYISGRLDGLPYAVLFFCGL
jgi:hypothetical protein